jgi:hypothetical protein
MGEQPVKLHKIPIMFGALKNRQRQFPVFFNHFSRLFGNPA